MFRDLFSEAGLSLDRLRALVEVGAAGSIVKASGGDPVKQSQYSRQIKELENFFRVRLTERQGKCIRLMPRGKELARISRFFLLGLSNFRRGCLTEEQRFRIGAGATFIDRFLLPHVAGCAKAAAPAGLVVRYAVETVTDDEIERRLHDLTLDFGVVTVERISRPLQLKVLGEWRLQLWVPRGLYRSERLASQAFQEKQMPLALAVREFPLLGHPLFQDWEPRIRCGNFLEAKAALAQGGVGAFLPDFLVPRADSPDAIQVPVPAVATVVFSYRLAWNPRLLRLNPPAVQHRDALGQSLAGRFAQISGRHA